MTPPDGGGPPHTCWVWGIGIGLAALLVGYCAWLFITDAPAWRFLVRLYVDKRFLKHTLREWGVVAPVIFIGLQALQVVVVVAPIPGEVTGILGGYLFGEWLGFLHSTIGLTLGSVAASNSAGTERRSI